jgi:hypothetical protein
MANHVRLYTIEVDIPRGMMQQTMAYHVMLYTIEIDKPRGMMQQTMANHVRINHRDTEDT